MALMLTRIFAGTNFALGVANLGAAILISLTEIFAKTSNNSILDGVVGYLCAYGAVALVGGIALFLTSKKIARYASRT